MDGKQILGFLNYLMASLIFIMGLVSVLLFDQRKKLTYLFLMFLCTGLLSFLFFAGLAFVFPAIVIVGFCIILFLFIQNQEFFGTGKIKEKELRIDNHPLSKISLIINTALSILVVLPAGFLFYTYNNDFYKNMDLVANFNTINLQEIINGISSNYIPLIIVFLAALAMSVVWFISMIEDRSKRN